MNKIRVLISGRVQGVGFRYWLRGKMKQLGVSGEVQNSEDGTVSAEFEGTKEQNQKIIACCQQGPALAKVLKVDILKSDD